MEAVKPKRIRKHVANRRGGICRPPHYGEIDTVNNKEAYYIFRNNQDLPLLEKEIIEYEDIDPDYEMKLFKQQIWGLLDILDRREKYIMFMYYKYDLTGEEIGKILFVSSKRIYQIISKCIRKLKGYVDSKYGNYNSLKFNGVTSDISFSEAREKGLEKNIPNEILHSQEWLNRYNTERNKVDYGEAYQLPVTPLEEEQEVQPPVVKKQIPKIDIYKDCRYSYSSFPIHVWWIT